MTQTDWEKVILNYPTAYSAYQAYAEHYQPENGRPNISEFQLLLDYFFWSGIEITVAPQYDRWTVQVVGAGPFTIREGYLHRVAAEVRVVQIGFACLETVALGWAAVCE